ncbi:MAG: tetratricopeptide repeat protein, partial [Candidatus Acidiferrales bacterium]
MASGLVAAFLLGAFLAPRALPEPLPAADATISVLVTDESGVNLGQVKLELVKFPDSMVETLLTDSGGRAEFRHLTGGNYIIRATKDGYTPGQIELYARPNQGSFLARIQLKPEAKPSERGGKVSVRELSIPGKAHSEFLRGVEFMKGKNDPQRSIEHFQKAIHEYPDYYEAYFLLGMAQAATSAPDDAIESLRKSIELKSSFMEPYYPLGVLLETRKDYAEAERVLEAAFEQDP